MSSTAVSLPVSPVSPVSFAPPHHQRRLAAPPPPVVRRGLRAEPNDDEYVGLAQASALTGVSTSTLRKAAGRGRLGPVDRAGGRNIVVRWGNVRRYHDSSFVIRSLAQRARRAVARGELTAEEAAARMDHYRRAEPTALLAGLPTDATA